MNLRIGLPLLMLAGLACFRATEPGAPGRGTDERVVQDFVAGFGRRPARALLRLFAEDATVSIEGLHIELRGAEEIRQFAEYGSAVGSRMSAFELSRRGAAVLAQIREENEWFKLLGVPEAFYRGRFTVARGRIASAVLDLEPDSRDALAGRLASFVIWLSANDPEAMGRLMPGGRLKPDAAAFREALALLQRWRSGSR